MTTIVELIPDPEQGGFTARVPDIPAYGEGETENEAIADLREALRGHIETFGLDDALARVISPTIRHVDLDLAELAISLSGAINGPPFRCMAIDLEDWNAPQHSARH